MSAPSPDAIDTAPPPGFAGPWRRGFALLVDTLAVVLLGLALGVLMGETLARLGGWERVFGFALALAYRGLLGSRLGGGQTLGKRLSGIRVVGRDGAPLPVWRALLRETLFLAPFFLLGAPVPPDALLGATGIVLAIVLVGGLFALAYLFLCNGRGRRTLHDLLAGSAVVRAAAAPPVPPAWRGHLVVIGVVAALAATAPLVAARLISGTTVERLLPVHAALRGAPGVLDARVSAGTAWRGPEKSTSLVLVLRLSGADVDEEFRARELATQALVLYPEGRTRDVVKVVLTHGYDMVIASDWRRRTFVFDPDALVPPETEPDDR